MANNQRLNAIITIGAAMAGSVRSTMRGVAGQLASVGTAITDIARRQREIERQRSIWQREGRAVDDLDRELQQLGETMDSLRRRQERLQRLSAGISGVGSAWRNTGDTIRRQARVIGLAVGAVGAAIGATTFTTARAVEEQTRWANRIGVTTDFLSRLDYATQQYGVQTEDLVDGLKELSLRADEFAVTGVGPAAEAFARLGLSQEQVNALSADTAALFAEVHRRMSQIQNDSERQRISDEIFGGTAGERLIEVLRLSQDELSALMDEAERAGAVIDSDLATRSREFSREFGRLGAVMTGVFRTIGRELMPVVTTELQHVNEWLIANRGRVGDFAVAFVDWARDAVPVVRDIVSGLMSVGEALGNAIAWSADLLGGWENLGIAVGTAFVAPSILAVGRLGAAIGGLILATGPVGMVIAGVALAATLIIANWDSIRDAGIAAWEGLKDGAEAAVDWVVDKFRWLGEQVTAFMRPIRDAFSWVGDRVAAAAQYIPGVGPAPSATSDDPAERAAARRRSRSLGYGQPGDQVAGARASGGPIMPGQVYRFAEQGEERIFASRQAYVATARQTAALGGGRVTNIGGITIHAAPGADPSAIADAVLRQLADRERGAMYDGGQ